MADRIFYAVQQVAIGTEANTWQVLKGVQSVSMTTTFNLEQAFQLGQLAIYENIEGVPNIEMTINRLLDGTCLAYVAAAGGFANAANVSSASQNRFLVKLGIWDEANNTSAGAGNVNPDSQVAVSGAQLSSVTYTLGVDGNFTEEIALSATDKAWSGDCAAATGWAYPLEAADTDFQNDNGTPAAVMGVQRREYFDTVTSSLPSDIPEGKNRIQSITVSADFGREDLFELGSKGPFAKAATFPLEVTCSIEVLSSGGDLVSAAAEGCTAGAGQCDLKSNLTNQTIDIYTCDGTRLNLGANNKLSSVSYGGGDAGGGNVTTTFDYVTFNELAVSGSGAFSPS